MLISLLQEVANMAEWEDEQIEYIKEKVTEEGRETDLKKGKQPAQVNSLVNLNSNVFAQENDFPDFSTYLEPTPSQKEEKPMFLFHPKPIFCRLHWMKLLSCWI